MKITTENYYQDKTHLTNSMLQDFLKNEYYFKLKSLTLRRKRLFTEQQLMIISVKVKTSLIVNTKKYREEAKRRAKLSN